jgi:preprotein translocase subunit YajC
MYRTFLNFMILISTAVVAVTLSVATALAQTPPAGAGGAAVSPLMNLVPFIVMLGIMYMLMIRPQMKKQKQHQTFLGGLKRGDEVLTSGGILGRIEGLTDLFITLEIAPGVRIKVLRSQVSSSAAMAASNVGDNKIETPKTEKNEGRQ